MLTRRGFLAAGAGVPRARLPSAPCNRRAAATACCGAAATANQIDHTR